MKIGIKLRILLNILSKLEESTPVRITAIQMRSSNRESWYISYLNSISRLSIKPLLINKSNEFTSSNTKFPNICMTYLLTYESSIPTILTKISTISDSYKSLIRLFPEDIVQRLMKYRPET